jgi:hypothetical protein
MTKTLLLCLMLTISACAPYGDYYHVDNVQLIKKRQMETKHFESNDEVGMLSACIQVLQDLGFTIEESNAKLGLVTATKDRSAGSEAEKMMAISFAQANGSQPVYDVSQKIYVTLLSTQNRNKGGYNIRISFSNIITDNMGRTRVRKINNPDIFGDFFNKLSQSLFLTANDI